jgi:hypothetical protein
LQRLGGKERTNMLWLDVYIGSYQNVKGTQQKTIIFLKTLTLENQ